MSEEGVKRRLTTILAADVVGYSRLMALSGGTRHRPATPELRPGADIENQMSALSDFRRLYPQLRTRMAPLVTGGY